MNSIITSQKDDRRERNVDFLPVGPITRHRHRVGDALDCEIQF